VLRSFAAVAGVLGVIVACGTARAQSSAAAPKTIPIGDWLLSPSLELRTRAEYRRDAPQLAGVHAGSQVVPSGTAPPLIDDAYGVLERTRVGLGAEYGAAQGAPSFLRAQVTIQDARAWGVPGPTGMLGAEGSGPASFGVYEGWVDARTSSARPAYVRLGRQAITWGDGRLLSNADWSPVARTLDGVRAHASLGLFDFEVLAAILDTPTLLGAAYGPTNLTSGTPVIGATGTELYGAQVAASLDPLLKLELSLLAREASAESAAAAVNPFHETETYVASLRAAGDAHAVRYAVEGVYEAAKPLTAKEYSSLGAAAVYIERTFDSLLTSPALRLEADYASGPKSGGVPFDPILPDVHELHGAMDLFAWSNTAEASARVTVAPWSEGKVAAEYRYARLASTNGPWVDAYLTPIGSGGAQEELGHEVDVWTSWHPWPVLDLRAGYSLFAIEAAARNAMTAPGSGRPTDPPGVSHFGYLQATLRVP
jgi:hypothetical protein